MIELTQEQITKNWNSGEKELKVSVWVTAYNHEKYISHTLDSILEQKTDFPFEIIVHDDASTDATARIIRQYEKTFPAVIKAFIQKENQWLKGGGGITKVFYENMRGKYIARCEGDDFWINPHRLQEQVDFLESHSEFCATAARRIRVDESEKIIPYLHYKKDVIITPKNVFNMPEMIHLSTIMHINHLRVPKMKEQNNKMMQTQVVGDWRLLMLLVDAGNMYVSKKKYSAIRRVLRPDASNYNSIMKFQRNKFDVLKNRFVSDCAMKEFEFERIHYKYSKPKNAAKFLFESLKSNKKEQEYARTLYKNEYLPRMSKTEAVAARLLLWYPIYDSLKEKYFSFKCKQQTKSELGKDVNAFLQSSEIKY